MTRCEGVTRHGRAFPRWTQCENEAVVELTIRQAPGGFGHNVTEDTFPVCIECWNRAKEENGVHILKAEQIKPSIQTISTTIKKCYMDQIRSGKKTVEYKGMSAFWECRLQKLIDRENVVINFLCGQASYKYAVKKVVRVMSNTGMDIDGTRYYSWYEIHLGDPLPSNYDDTSLTRSFLGFRCAHDLSIRTYGGMRCSKCGQVLKWHGDTSVAAFSSMPISQRSKKNPSYCVDCKRRDMHGLSACRNCSLRQ